LGAAGADAYSLEHPVVPDKRGVKEHLQAFAHSGRSCPHLKLQQKIWVEKSNDFYQSMTSLLSDAGFGPGALLELKYRKNHLTGFSETRHVVVTGFNFNSPMLYGMGVVSNGLLKISSNEDWLNNKNVSLYMHDILSQFPDVGWRWDDRKEFLSERLPQLDKDRRFQFDTWNRGWQTDYNRHSRAFESIKVIAPASLEVPAPKVGEAHSDLLKAIRKDGQARSKQIREWYWNLFN
jgi:hypothetical protein